MDPIMEINSLELRIDELEEEVRFLHCLRAAGVDNWEGYDVAQDMFADDSS